MAGSRREALGSVLQRFRGLLRSGAMKEEDRPIWYDVVKAFPPRPLPPPTAVKRILYPEDHVRVQFHRTYQHNGLTTLSLSDKSPLSIPERFVNTYIELHRQQTVPPGELFEATAKLLQDKGVKLVPHGAEPVVKSQPETQPPSPSPEPQSSQDLQLDSLFSNFENEKR